MAKSIKINEGYVDSTNIVHNKELLSDLLEDSGWQDLELEDTFEIYNSTLSAKYRKIGKIVEVVGQIKPTEAITASSSGTTFATLPSGYRPAYKILVRCQGSGMNTWLLGIDKSGILEISRYGSSSMIDIPTTAWLTFHAIFTVE